MDIFACIEHLKAAGCEVEHETLADGSRRWLVFDTNAPGYAENFGWPDFYTDAQLVDYVARLGT